MCEGEERVGGGEFRVQFDGALQQVASRDVRRLRQPVPQLPATQKAVIRLQVVGCARAPAAAGRPPSG